MAKGVCPGIKKSQFLIQNLPVSIHSFLNWSAGSHGTLILSQVTHTHKAADTLDCVPAYYRAQLHTQTDQFTHKRLFGDGQNLSMHV